ncbi:hypothetical protein Trydic_g19681 [Trypoxylus dichotomus]
MTVISIDETNTGSSTTSFSMEVLFLAFAIKPARKGRDDHSGYRRQEMQSLGDRLYGDLLSIEDRFDGCELFSCHPVNGHSRSSSRPE